MSRIMDRVAGVVDRFLGRFSEYRLVLLVLAGLAGFSFYFAATGGLFTAIFRPGWMLASLAVLLAASLLTNALLGALFKAHPNPESAAITALLLWFLYWPATTIEGLAWLALPAALAMASKYLIAYRGRHIVNPAAAGVLLTVVIQHLLGVGNLHTTWWIATDLLVPWVVIGALMVLRRSNKLTMGATFVVVGSLAVMAGEISNGALAGEALRTALVSYPLIFLAGFMLSEPLTLPPRHRQKIIAAVVAALVLGWGPLTGAVLGEAIAVPVFGGTTELALLAANLIGFTLGQRRTIRLRLVGRKRLGDLVFCDFEPDGPLRFEPGQYAELHVPHRDVDLKGYRRILSIASGPGHATVRFGFRSGPVLSSFKRTLLELPLDVDSGIKITQIGGDFILPEKETPLLMVAGGIGVTPFLSQAAQLAGDDAVLVYGVRDEADLDVIAHLEQMRVIVVMAGRLQREIPASWTHVDAAFITVAAIEEVVPDMGRRTAYVSGSSAMVHAIESALRDKVAKVRTDLFSGY